VFNILPMMGVEYDISTILDFGEREELLAELAAIEAYVHLLHALSLSLTLLIGSIKHTMLLICSQETVQ
jgi:hypothetical protein